MGVGDSRAEDGDEIAQKAQPVEGRPKGGPAKRPRRGFVADSSALDDVLKSSALTSLEKASVSLDALLRNSSALTSLERAFDTFGSVNAYFESTRRFLEQSGPVAAIERMQADFARNLESASGAAALAASMRWVDQLTPLEDYLDQVTATSRLAETIAGPGALTSWRSAIEANSRIEARLHGLIEPSLALSELARISRVQVELTDWAVQHAPGIGLLSATSGLPMVAWRNFVQESGDHPDELPMVMATGRTNLSLLGSDLLASPDVDPGLAAEGADRIESEVVEPWMAARLEVTAELYAVLAQLDPKVAELLNGAWDDVRRNGPAAAEKAANCTVEAVERALRRAAPDDAVRAWHAENDRPAKEWEGQDRPPHALRVKYLVRNLSGPRPLVESQATAFASVVGRLRKQLQATKHASAGDLVAVRNLLITAESLLISLLVGPSSPES